MKCLLRALLGPTLLLLASAAIAEFHLYRIDEIYSNTDGTVQYLVMHESMGANGENLWAGNPLIAMPTHAGTTKTFIFPQNLPGGMCTTYGCESAPTANTRVLIGTQGFAALGLITPDYIVPNGFFATDGVTVNYAGVDQVTFTSIPTDGTHAVTRGGNIVPNLATNFAGESATVSGPSVLNFSGLWYKSPAESEAGWGINFAHQGDVIFATWFTYDVNGKAWWLTMTANKTAEGVYSGQLIRTNATPFSAYVPPATATIVGTGTLTFASATTGTFSYTVNDGANMATQTKAIVLQTFGPVPTCVWGAQADLTKATNYQDLWWAGAATGDGWGVNLTQQGTTIFATWFTYDANHNPLWLSVTAPQTASNTYSGTLDRTSGPTFNAFDPTLIRHSPSGTATFTFTDGNSGMFSYNVDLGDGVNKATQAKAITRQVFRPPGTVCQ